MGYNEQCHILFPSWGKMNCDDITGCLKENHYDAHICLDSDGVFIEWEDDPDCTCDECMNEYDASVACKVTKELTKQQVLEKLGITWDELLQRLIERGVPIKHKPAPSDAGS